jgi:son of sevenless
MGAPALQSTFQNGVPDADDGQCLRGVFCRALYDYESDDSSSLPFREGDIIEVLTRLDSGWWDGLLHDERGWFPSTYVALVSEQDIVRELGAAQHWIPRIQMGNEDDAQGAEDHLLATRFECPK